MSSVNSAKNSERAKIFETVLSSPGMKETCKIVLSPSRQTILLLCHLIEQGIENKEGNAPDEMLSFMPSESRNELKLIVDEMLKKSGLVEFYQRLKLL
jgi:hypothetical protein